MILKRQEKDGVVKAIYDSSNILASIYEKEDLTIIFKDGRQYTYSKVSKTDYTRFEIAESQGAVLNSHIKKYPFIKLDSMDPQRILTEIESIKNADQQQLQEANRLRIFKSAKKILLYQDVLPVTEEALRNNDKMLLEEVTNLKNIIEAYIADVKKNQKLD